MKLPISKEKIRAIWYIWALIAIILLTGAIIDYNLIAAFSDRENSYHTYKPSEYYYNFLRFAVCGLSIYGLYLTRMTLGVNKQSSRIGAFIVLQQVKGMNTLNDVPIEPSWKNILFSWWFVFLIIAIVFNPIFPLRFDKTLWQVIDLITIVILIISLFLFRPHKIVLVCDQCGIILTKGYYRNYEKSKEYHNPIGNHLCFGCLKKLVSSKDGIEVDTGSSGDAIS